MCSVNIRNTRQHTAANIAANNPGVCQLIQISDSIRNEYVDKIRQTERKKKREKEVCIDLYCSDVMLLL